MDTQPQVKEQHRVTGWRMLLAVLFGVIASGYAIGIVLGVIPQQQRLDTQAIVVLALAALVIGVLVSPGLLDRFKRLELQGFKLEMLEKVKDRQAQQEERLDDIALMLPLLFPKQERKHLLALLDARTQGYKGSHSVRTELRRLREIGLLRTRSTHRIGDLKDGLELDLATIVELTTLGERWARRLKELEAAEETERSP